MKDPAENELREWALLYGSLGWRIVPLHNQTAKGECTCQPWRTENAEGPCPNPGKHPRFRGFAEKASSDPGVIAAWWQRWPAANVGLITGAGSGVWAFDTDPRNGGDTSRDSLVYHHGQFPYTTTNRTGGGGTHEIFRWPADFAIPPALELDDGIDILGEGHVLVLPPSLHPSGRRYAWEPELGPDEQPPVDAPAWLLERLRTAIATAAATAPAAPRSDFRPVPIEPILAGCAWLRHCRDDAGVLNEPQWYAMLSIVGRCVDGERLAHTFSSPFARYSAVETAAKLARALQNSGPVTCAKVRNSLNGARYCEVCPHAGLVKSPIVLATVHPPLPDPPPLNLDETGIPGPGDPSTASGSEPVNGRAEAAVSGADIEAAVDQAIAANDVHAALAIAPQLGGQAEFTQARLKLKIREHFGRRISMRDFESLMKAPKSAAAKKSRRRRADPAVGENDPTEPKNDSGAGSGGPPPRDWRRKLMRGREGEPLGSLANAIVALRYAPEWDGVIWRDDFGECAVVRKKPPIAVAAEGKWENLHDILTTDWLQRHSIGVSVQITAMAVEAVAHDRRFHPVREYLSALEWDGGARLDRWLETYLGAELDPTASDSEADTAPGASGRARYLREIGAKWMISAVARVFQPGCKVDCMLILEGQQGTRKSTALKTLGHRWFTDEIAEMGSKDSSMQMHGKWIIEVGELESMTKAEVGSVKAFVSRPCDRYRPPYASRLVEMPRQCVFAGSVNGGSYLRDETGGRRFWPVACTTIALEDLVRDRDQLWAEAMFRYTEGATWWIENAETAAQAELEQEDRYRGDVWDSAVHTYIEYRPEVSIDSILGPECLGIEIGRQSQSDYNRVSAILRAAGWKKIRPQKGGRKRVYRPTARVSPVVFVDRG